MLNNYKDSCEKKKPLKDMREIYISVFDIDRLTQSIDILIFMDNNYAKRVQQVWVFAKCHSSLSDKNDAIKARWTVYAVLSSGVS